jgi:hypothetical protein
MIAVGLYSVNQSLIDGIGLSRRRLWVHFVKTRFRIDFVLLGAGSGPGRKSVYSIERGVDGGNSSRKLSLVGGSVPVASVTVRDPRIGVRRAIHS